MKLTWTMKLQTLFDLTLNKDLLSTNNTNELTIIIIVTHSIINEQLL